MTTSLGVLRTHAAHKLWLKITAVVIGSFGPIFFLGTMKPTQEPARLTLDLLSWPVDGATTYAHPDTRFLSALTGGFLFGWGVTVWFLSSKVYDLAPEPVRRCVVTGVCAWFCLDSLGSIASGNASNALFNVLVLALAIGPMWMPASGTGELEPTVGDFGAPNCDCQYRSVTRARSSRDRPRVLARPITDGASSATGAKPP